MARKKKEQPKQENEPLSVVLGPSHILYIAKLLWEEDKRTYVGQYYGSRESIMQQLSLKEYERRQRREIAQLIVGPMEALDLEKAENTNKIAKDQTKTALKEIKLTSDATDKDNDNVSREN